jgi:serine/threonine protein phosphatase 1
MVSWQTYLPIASKRPERNWRFTTHYRSRIFAFRNLREAFASGDFFFVHAGVKPDVDLAHQTENDLLWIRHEFLSSSRDFGKIIIHGHTPTTEIELRSNRINIDTGAFATGRLTCLVIEGETLSLIDTVPN